ncbi:GL23734 [Drosophila persimilis]|uniref:GL23734 n=1 Tax=Drosophila persimilis TaxID=7234 RepID=B4G625_DROPE|nr:gliolectin [Drosophila persimilis]EDW23784.1 GL23734 [Drosophila persimilis]
MAPIQVPPLWSSLTLEPRRPTPVAVANRARCNLFGTDRDEVSASINKSLANVTEKGLCRVRARYGVDILAEEELEQLNRLYRLPSKCQTMPFEPSPAGVALTPSQIATTAKVITNCAERKDLMIRSCGQKPYGRLPQGIKGFYRERKAPKTISNVPKCSNNNNNNKKNNNNNNNTNCTARVLDSGNSEIGKIVNKKDE